MGFCSVVQMGEEMLEWVKEKLIAALAPKYIQRLVVGALAAGIGWLGVKFGIDPDKIDVAVQVNTEILTSVITGLIAVYITAKKQNKK